MNWEAAIYSLPVSAVFMLIIIYPLIFNKDKDDKEK